MRDANAIGKKFYHVFCPKESKSLLRECKSRLYYFNSLCSIDVFLQHPILVMDEFQPLLILTIVF